MHLARPRWRWMTTLARTMVIAVGAVGCYADYVDGYPVSGVVIAPPAPRYEVVPPIPYPGAVWIGGRWAYTGGRYSWIGGRYVAPRRGRYYAPGYWHHDGRHWGYAPGGWHHGHHL